MKLTAVLALAPTAAALVVGVPHTGVARTSTPCMMPEMCEPELTRAPCNVGAGRQINP